MGITDYLLIDNYKKFLSYVESGKITKKFDFIIPNIELRLTPVTGDGKALNLHLLFDPAFVNQLDSRIYPKLKVKNGNTEYTAAKADLIRLGKAFFIELGLQLEGETTVEGPLVGRLIGLKDVRATLAMMRTPDGQGIELDKFHTPEAIRFGPMDAPVNTLGIRRVMFAVDNIDAIVARMQAHGAELIGEMQYGDTYRLAYIRGPEGIIIGLAEQLQVKR